MGDFVRATRLVIAVLSFLPVAALAREGTGVPPVELKPTTGWNIDYADDSCRLTRNFGDGEDAAAFYVERFSPNEDLFLVVASKRFEAPEGSNVSYRFGPDGFSVEKSAIPGVIPNVGPALFASNMTLVPVPEREKPPLTFERSISGDQEAAIKWFEVQLGKKRAVRFLLGPMNAPMKALRACTDELLTHWGVDVEQHRTMTQPAIPASDPGHWFRSKDYPRAQLAAGSQGFVHFRLAVGADGKPTACKIQQSTRPGQFDAATCKVLMKNAGFSPALDASGKPMPSFWQKSIHFDIVGP